MYNQLLVAFNGSLENFNRQVLPLSVGDLDGTRPVQVLVRLVFQVDNIRTIVDRNLFKA